LAGLKPLEISVNSFDTPFLFVLSVFCAECLKSVFREFRSYACEAIPIS
jgi:hypothetical protein